MKKTQAVFDGLANNYERYRPKYPKELFVFMQKYIKQKTNNTQYNLLDAGSGSGIALEGLYRYLSAYNFNCTAVDISADMIKEGQQKKIPNVKWIQQQVEEFLEKTTNSYDIVIAAQSYQWLERQKFLQLVYNNLTPQGFIVIMQNNRDYANSPFLQEYESLIEQHRRGDYNRHYREFDIINELNQNNFKHDKNIDYYCINWLRDMTSEDFIKFSQTSSQVQKIQNQEEFLQDLNNLIKKYQYGGKVKINYNSEVFIGLKS